MRIIEKSWMSGLAWACLLALIAAASLLSACGARAKFYQPDSTHSAKGESVDPNQCLYRMSPPQVQTRWFTFENPQGTRGAGGQANFGRKGAPCTVIPAGGSLVLADIQGPGTIRRIWSTLWYRDPKALRSLKIEMYWDGAATPAVQAPFGDFFGHSLGQMCAFENACFSSPEARSFNCVVPMPFKKGARIVVTNESDKENGIYYEIDTTLGDRHDDETLYFHSYWRRENPTQLRRDMTILPAVSGRGRFLGCALGVNQNPVFSKMWWGEGEVKVYLDGDREFPTLVGTGTEDYIGTGYGQGVYSNLYQGNPYVAPTGHGPNIMDAYGFYRFHIPDPVFFHENIRVTIQVIGGPSHEDLMKVAREHPDGKILLATDGTEYLTPEMIEQRKYKTTLTERSDDHCATAYWYLDRPENGLPPLAPVAERTAESPWKS